MPIRLLPPSWYALFSPSLLLKVQIADYILPRIQHPEHLGGLRPNSRLRELAHGQIERPRPARGAALTAHDIYQQLHRAFRVSAEACAGPRDADLRALASGVVGWDIVGLVPGPGERVGDEAAGLDDQRSQAERGELRVERLAEDCGCVSENARAETRAEGTHLGPRPWKSRTGL